MSHPFIKWAGGKRRLLSTLFEIMDDAVMSEKKVYVEPFVGSGAVLFAVLEKKKFEKIIINDLNASLIETYLNIKNNLQTLLTELKTIETDYEDKKDKSKYYYEKRVEYNGLASEIHSIKRSALFIFLNKTCYNGIYRVNSSGSFNVPIGKNSLKTLFDYENLKNVSVSLKEVVIEQGSYIDFFVKHKDEMTSDWLIYVDPPYSTRDGKNEFTSYNKQTFDWTHQVELEGKISDIVTTGASVVLSNVSSQCLKEIYSDKKYALHEFDRSCTIGGTATSRKKYGEIMITSNINKNKRNSIAHDLLDN